MEAEGTGDTLVGKNSNVTFITQSSTDVVTALGTGNTVESYASFTAPANVSSLIGEGSAAIILGLGNMSGNVTGNSGNDTLTSGTGTHSLTGGAGYTTITTGAGTDTIALGGGGGAINMGTGTETAALGAGAATVQFSSGTDKLTFGTGQSSLTFSTGTNQVTDNATAGSSAYNSTSTITTDTAESTQTGSLTFGSATSNQLWFERSGNNLEILTIGTSHMDVITNWFSGASNDVASIKASDGKTLVDSQVANLVSAMAAFSPPAAGSTAFTTQEQTALATQLAASWH